jgi:hypothetical protein
MLKTRWLLSLHKGPLTDSEITALTLKPPKPKKATPKKEKLETEDKKEKIVPSIGFKSKKPAMGKITERFLSPKIKPENKEHSTVIQERLSLSGNPEQDGLYLELGQFNRYYSPLYFTKTLIDIKRIIKEDQLQFPVQIKEEMTRTFDLRKIDWNSTTIEGIHASSLPARDLAIQPISGYKFLEFDKEVITKLPENLIWYFTQNPFPEAESIYQERLREFEREEISKLAGKKVGKELSKLSTQISGLEEKMQTENQKLDETLIRLENLEGERKARVAEGRSVRAIERSIDSTSTKQRRHDDRIKELRKQIANSEKKRQDLFKEKQENYEAFHNSVEVLKSQGVPPDLYRPGKADVSIIEKSVYWVPRLFVPVTLKVKSEDLEAGSQFFLNLNLFNGNAELTCDGCGPQISTENYYQSLLAVEISPPTFVCTTCLKLFCSEHITFCQKCGKTACLDHSEVCKVCEQTLCGECSAFDPNTEATYCLEHTPKLCQGCKNSFAPELLSVCKKCGTEVCDSCGRVKVKIKNEEVIARCVNCS